MKGAAGALLVFLCLAGLPLQGPMPLRRAPLPPGLNACPYRIQCHPGCTFPTQAAPCAPPRRVKCRKSCNLLLGDILTYLNLQVRAICYSRVVGRNSSFATLPTSRPENCNISDIPAPRSLFPPPPFPLAPPRKRLNLQMSPDREYTGGKCRQIGNTQEGTPPNQGYTRVDVARTRIRSCKPFANSRKCRSERCAFIRLTGRARAFPI